MRRLIKRRQTGDWKYKAELIRDKQADRVARIKRMIWFYKRASLLFEKRWCDGLFLKGCQGAADHRSPRKTQVYISTKGSVVVVVHVQHCSVTTGSSPVSRHKDWLCQQRQECHQTGRSATTLPFLLTQQALPLLLLRFLPRIWSSTLLPQFRLISGIRTMRWATFTLGLGCLVESSVTGKDPLTDVISMNRFLTTDVIV